MERKTIYTIIAAVLCIVFSTNIYNSVESFKYRRLCNEYREQLIVAEKTNRELADRIGRITEITRRIKKTADANITNARGIIELVEQIRAQVYELESSLGCFNQSEYYEYWDNELGISQ